VRALDPAFAAAVDAGVIIPAVLAELTFASGVQRVWTGVGTLSWNGYSWLGLSRLAGMGAITEGVTVNAEGTTVSLSGIDPTLYAESLTDIQIGAPATLWLALLHEGVFVGTPAKLFAGAMDQPSCSAGTDKITISIALETKMTNLKRASCSRYTAADQQVRHPADKGFNWVERLNDIALKWGSA